MTSHRMMSSFQAIGEAQRLGVQGQQEIGRLLARHVARVARVLARRLRSGTTRSA